MPYFSSISSLLFANVGVRIKMAEEDVLTTVSTFFMKKQGGSTQEQKANYDFYNALEKM